jgi:hypothetical protein
VPISIIVMQLLSNVQVQASIGTLHRAIDNALSRRDRRHNRQSDADQRFGAAEPESEAALKPAAAVEALAVPAPAELVFVPYSPSDSEA